MEALKGGEYLLDGYISYEKHLELKRDDTSYNFTYFQLNHEDEYLIKKDKVVSLFHKAVISNKNSHIVSFLFIDFELGFSYI